MTHKRAYEAPEACVFQVEIQENFLDSVQYSGLGMEDSANPVFNDFIWGD